MFWGPQGRWVNAHWIYPPEIKGTISHVFQNSDFFCAEIRTVGIKNYFLCDKYASADWPILKHNIGKKWPLLGNWGVLMVNNLIGVTINSRRMANSHYKSIWSRKSRENSYKMYWYDCLISLCLSVRLHTISVQSIFLSFLLSSAAIITS